MLGAYAKWSMRLMFIELKEWLPDLDLFDREINL